MIKRLILILGLTMAWAGLSHAQYAFPSEVTSKGSRILVDGEKLTAQQAAQLFSEFGGEQMGLQDWYDLDFGRRSDGRCRIFYQYCGSIAHS